MAAKEAQFSSRMCLRFYLEQWSRAQSLFNFNFLGFPTHGIAQFANVTHDISKHGWEHRLSICDCNLLAQEITRVIFYG